MIAPAPRLRLEVGTGVCALPGETECGDACDVVPWSKGVLLALADGLGHGPQAATAARAFLASVRVSVEQPLEELFARAHHALLKTRGVVAAVARFDAEAGEMQIAGLGNITVLIVRTEHTVERPVLVPGVLGSAYRQVRPQRLSFGAGDLALLHTDGVRARLDPRVWRGLSAQSAVDSVLRTHARRGDDAGCVVARGALQLEACTAQSACPSHDSGRLQREIPVHTRSDADCAAQEARSFAELVGLGARAQWEVSIATSELATNIAKYAGRGLIRLEFEPGPLGALVVEAIDSGAGIPDLQAAFADGFSEAGTRAERPRALGEGLGVGLGSVRRMMDDVAVQSDGASGTRIVARKRLAKTPV